MSCQAYDCSNGLNPKLFGCCGTTKVTKQKNKAKFTKDCKSYQDEIDCLVKRINKARKNHVCGQGNKAYNKKVDAQRARVNKLKKNLRQKKKDFRKRTIVKVDCVQGQSCCGCC